MQYMIQCLVLYTIYDTMFGAVYNAIQYKTNEKYVTNVICKAPVQATEGTL